jgi:pyruvate/2-oxoglutarate dehydrogenase complex dihydrolipoamide acyltransferase (E2) component
MVREDPLYASVFLANLGSIGLEAPFHHLYEYGTVPLFAVIGRISKEPIVDADGALAVGQVVHLRYTLDERIADGFYCARSLELLRELLEHPERLAHLASP